VNNAGISSLGAAEEVTLAEWQRVIDINLAGVFFTAQAAARRMILQRSGSIVNIASMSGLIVNVPQKQSVYNISRRASSWRPKVSRRNGPSSASVSTRFAPGYMRTEMTARFFEDADFSRSWIEATPMRRPGEPEELGGAVVYLASQASSFVTGSVLLVDGGYVVR